MSKLEEATQFQSTGDVHIFKCFCGEDSYLEVIQDPDDGEYYITITKHPTRIRERLVLAWKALWGIEFTASNSVMILPEDADKLIAALTLSSKKYKKK